MAAKKAGKILPTDDQNIRPTRVVTITTLGRLCWLSVSIWQTDVLQMGGIPGDANGHQEL